MTTTLYDLSGGMESAAMLVVDRERIREKNAIVRWADTGKQFPEMVDSIAQISDRLGIEIFRVGPRITFDEFLFERGGMIRKGTTDCSRRMKRANLMAHMKTFPKPTKWNNTITERNGVQMNGAFEDAIEINLGFNAEEVERMDSFVELNERDWCHWRFPLIEAHISRDATHEICERAGFTILLGMYKKMGRFDCFWCGNQTPSQALRVAEYYPELAKQWMAAEARKVHSFMRIPLKTLVENDAPLFREQSTGCSCFGGSESVFDEGEGDDNA